MLQQLLVTSTLFPKTKKKNIKNIIWYDIFINIKLYNEGREIKN